MTQILTLTDLYEARAKRLDGYAYKLSENQFALDYVDTEAPTIDEARMSIRLCFADGNRRDGVGDITEVAGIRTERHRMNPISLFNHGKEVLLPIGLCEDPETKAYTVEIDPISRKACATIFFYQGKGFPKTPGNDYQHGLFCEQLFDLIAKGFIRGASFGYQTVKAMQLSPDYAADHAPPIPGHHLLVTVLLEAGPVIMPCNGDTLVQKMLDMPKICGHRPCEYLVKSLSPYAPERKAQLGYEGKSLIPGQEPAAQRTQDLVNPGWAGKAKKDISQVRLKYRKGKGLRRVRRKSSPGTSLVYAHEKDLQSIKDMAKLGGVKCEHCGPFGKMAKVRLTGDDGVIEGIARKYGKAVHYGSKSLMGTKAQPSENVTPEKARQILKDGEVRGHKITDKQRRMFGAASRKKALSGVTQTTYAKDPTALRKEAIDLLKKYVETAFEGYRERAWDALLESGLNLGGIPRTKQGAEKLIRKLGGMGIKLSTLDVQPLGVKSLDIGQKITLKSPLRDIRDQSKIHLVGSSGKVVGKSSYGYTVEMDDGGKVVVSENEVHSKNLRVKSMKYGKKNSPAEGDGASLPDDGGVGAGAEVEGVETDEKGLEPHGATVLRRVHEYHTAMLEEFDELLQVLENEPVKKHVTKILESIADTLDSTEALFDGEYSEGVEPLAGGKDLETEEEGDGETIERPEPEEAVEGMMTADEKRLIWAAQKVLRTQYGKSLNGKPRKKNFLGDETTEVETTKPKGPLSYKPGSEPLQQHTESVVPGGVHGSKANPAQGHEPGTEAQTGSELKIHPLEAAHVNNAKAFLKDLSDMEDGFDDEKRMTAFHFGKLLDPIHERFESFFKNFASEEDVEVEVTKPSGQLNYSPNAEPMQQHTESIVPGGVHGSKGAAYPDVDSDGGAVHGQGVGPAATEGDHCVHGQGVSGKALLKALQETKTFFKDLTSAGLKWSKDYKQKAADLYTNLKNFVSDETNEVEVTDPNGQLNYSPNAEPMQQHTESVVPGGVHGSKSFHAAVAAQNKQIKDLNEKLRKLVAVK